MRMASRDAQRGRAAGRRGSRRWVLLLHRVLGLAAGLPLVIAGLTGSALVFRQEIDTALNPRLLRVAPREKRVLLQPIVDRVVAEFPGEAPVRVRMPQRAGEVYEFWLGSAPTRYVYADPGRGTLLGSRRPTEFLTGWLFLLHSQLLAGDVGHTVGGISALALMVLALSGVVVWWPRSSPWRAWSVWRQSVTIARSSGDPRLTCDLHRAVGFYTAALLLIVGLTGASLVFPTTFQRAAFRITAAWPFGARHTVAPQAPDVAPLQYAERPARSVDMLLGIAERAQPGGTITYLYLPVAAGEPFRVRKRFPGETHPTGKSFVHVEPTTGRVVAVEDGVRAHAGARLYSVLYPIHTGVVGGWPTRLLAIAVGLSIPLLAGTGTLLWWRRAVRRHR